MTIHDEKEWKKGFTLENRDCITVGYERVYPHLLHLQAVKVPTEDKEPIPFKLVVESDKGSIPMVLIYQGEDLVQSFEKKAVKLLESYAFTPENFSPMSGDNDAPGEFYT